MDVPTEHVSFTTEDGVTIVGLVHDGPAEGPAALLVHMMPATKESWNVFADKLVQAGFGTVLAIDLRGHGESTAGPGGTSLDYRAFDDAQHQAAIHDVDAAAAWLRDIRHVDPKRLAIVGASIGANLAISYGADHPDIPAVVALSPGLDYRGITTGDKIGRFTVAQSLELVASDDDPASFNAVDELAVAQPHASVAKLSGAGHGTAMFTTPGVMDDVVAWLVAHTR
jgi:alpha-beta hydrolase superfamily lysophospholipase